jgi:hypothetical protein
MKAMRATFPSLLPSALDRFRLDFMASLSLPPPLHHLGRRSSSLPVSTRMLLARGEIVRKKYIRRAILGYRQMEEVCGSTH